MHVGIGSTARDFYDGQALASPGRWPLALRRYSQTDTWKALVVFVKGFSERFGITQLLMAPGARTCQRMPFPERGSERAQRRSRECVVISWTQAGKGEW